MPDKSLFLINRITRSIVSLRTTMIITRTFSWIVLDIYSRRVYAAEYTNHLASRDDILHVILTYFVNYSCDIDLLIINHIYSNSFNLLY